MVTWVVNVVCPVLYSGWLFDGTLQAWTIGEEASDLLGKEDEYLFVWGAGLNRGLRGHLYGVKTEVRTGQEVMHGHSA